MKKIVVIFILGISFCLLGAVEPVFLFDEKHQNSIILKDGAKLENGILKLDGKKGYATFKNSSKFNFCNTGMTLVGEVKLNEDDKVGNYIARDMIISKGYEIIFAREGQRIYYNFNSGKRWAATFWGGSIPPKNQWSQFVCVVERLNDITQAEVGYRVSFYINGEIEARGKFMYVTPKHEPKDIEIGRGFGGGTWLLNGQIAKAAVYDRPLSENEISQLMQKSKYVKVIENDVKTINKNIAQKLDNSEKVAKTPQGKFLANAVKLAVLDGYLVPEPEVIVNKNLLTSKLHLNELFTQYTKSQRKKLFELHSTNQIAVITAASNTTGTGFPIYGIYDKVAKRSIFGRKGIEWKINAITQNKKNITFTSFNSRWQILKSGKNFITIKWLVAPQIYAYSNVTINKSRVEANFKIDNDNHNIRIESVTFPKVRFQKLDGNDALTYPSMSGILVENPTKEQFPGGQEGFFPSGKANMQFSSYYNEKQGIYFAFEDPLARSKYYSVKGYRNNIVAMYDNLVGYLPKEEKGGNDFETSGNFVIELFKGDWFDGGQIYKRFLSNKAKWWIKDLPRTDTPKWFRNTCIRILGVKCSFEPSFIKTKNEVIKMRKYFDMPIAFHWYGWDDPAKGKWPHFYPKDFALKYLKELKDNDIYVKPYIDSRLWCVKDGANGKSDWMYSTCGKKFAVKNSNLTPVIEHYGAPFAVQCPAAKGWQEYMVSLVKRLAEYKFDAIYHDQVATAKYYPCYDKTHGHVISGNDVWIEKGYNVMFDKIRALKNQYPNLAHDTEEAADPYLKMMDGYMVWRWTDSNQIPLFASIYSGRIQFTGRLYNHQYPGDYESFFAKAAEQLVTSEQIGWFDYPDLRDPQKRLYIKKLGHLRYSLLNFFNEANMQHPLSFAKPIPLLKSKWGAVGNFSLVTTPKIRHGVYKRKDNLTMVVFTNSTKEKITIYPKLTVDKNHIIAVCKEGSPNYITTSKAPAVTLTSRSSEVWIIGNKEQASHEALRISKTMYKISTFNSQLR